MSSIFCPKTPMYQDTISKIYRDNPTTKNITFVVTENCNLKCTYCYEQHKTSRRMSLETGEKAIDMLFRMYAENNHYINKENSHAIVLEFIGGEPLLEIDLINDLVEYFKIKAISLNHIWATNYMISIISNGILYDQQKVQDFINRNKRHLSMAITIDGNKQLHDTCRLFPDGSGSYNVVEKAVKKLVKLTDNRNTKLTIAPANVPYLFKAIKNLYDLGFNDVYANCVFEQGWTTSHAKILYEQMKKVANFLIEKDRYKDFYVSLFDGTIGQPLLETDNQNWCGGTGKMLAIGVDGLIYPCLRYIPFSLDERTKPIIIGDIERGIGGTEEQKNNVSCLQCITRKSQSTNECFNCPIASGCAWCSAYNYQVNGSPNKRATFICPMHKARVLANKYFWDKMKINYELNIPKEWAVEIINEKEFGKLIKRKV